MITEKTFKLNIMNDKLSPVRYSVEQRNNETGLVKLKLNFTGISQVSAGKVSSFSNHCLGTRYY